ncbi:aldo/keto reductase [Glycomyces artemisiae]|uniref:Diketogulonate reductase-like aldo/keto reductase n=1 Tax=Glycomyces artemisiae TaxID=1076443 RepID=A0A2T0UHP5_9ACTN|nr:aldo/keto reductase [Glycomyces artemisiae]PRY57469.1 diketogulonate reductase-like aldo/keto reductase [Glycomyces artemisiae]
MSELSTAITLSGGASIPRFGYGTFRIEDGDTQAAVETALETGYRLLDTAVGYGNEEGVGRAVAASGLKREEVFLTSKVWEHGYDDVRRNLDESLERLGTDYLDLYLLHWPRPNVDLYVESWQALLDARSEGLIRAAGVSNFTIEHLDRIEAETGAAAELNQVELHPYFAQPELRAYHAEHLIATESWGPLALRGGALFDEPALQAVAAAHDRTPAQVALRWNLQRGNVVIPKSVTPDRIRENWAVLDFALTDEDLAAIDALDTGVRQGGDPLVVGND